MTPLSGQLYERERSSVAVKDRERRAGKGQKRERGGGIVPQLPVPGSATVRPHRQHAVLDACSLLIQII